MQRTQMHQVLDLVLDLGQRLMTRPIPPEAGQHFHAARREALLGIRSLVDAAIDRMDEAPTAPAGPTAIKIETD